MTEIALRGLLDAWRDAVDRHLPDRVAALFTDDAVFQGLHPYSVGPAGVREYYAGQPMGMAVTYDVLQDRMLADDVVLGFAAVEFTFAPGSRPPLPLTLTVVARRSGETWRIAHYHVSPRI
ncbi:SgcJ/EcaC family oxidoreductase [Actinoplanes sp. NPDC048796]|uniref:YybH family protein n=1 Tax=unclassified Actinoplanes TaxID=2626549 RepID=UPI0033C64BE8